jgi:hypothetical protein
MFRGERVVLELGNADKSKLAMVVLAHVAFSVGELLVKDASQQLLIALLVNLASVT